MRSLRTEQADPDEPLTEVVTQAPANPMDLGLLCCAGELLALRVVGSNRDRCGGAGCQGVSRREIDEIGVTVERERAENALVQLGTREEDHRPERLDPRAERILGEVAASMAGLSARIEPTRTGGEEPWLVLGPMDPKQVLTATQAMPGKPTDVDLHLARRSASRLATVWSVAASPPPAIQCTGLRPSSSG